MNEGTEMYKRIKSAILPVKIAFSDLYDICPYTKGPDDGLIVCTHPAAECLVPECMIDQCPLINDTARALNFLKNGSTGPRETNTVKTAQ